MDNNIEDKYLDKSLDLQERRHALEGLLRQEARDLKTISNACEILGLKDLAETLWGISISIKECATESSDIAGEELGNRVEEANQSTINTVTACLNIANNSKR